MKVLMINSVCGIRSTGRICTDCATELEARGHTVRIAYGRETVPEQYRKYAVRIGTDLDVRLHGLLARLWDADGRGSIGATRRFIKWVREYDPDVIHLHNLHGYYINFRILFDYLRESGKRIVWSLHDCWSFSGHSGTCRSHGCDKWLTGCGSCPAVHGYPASLTDRSAQNWQRKKKLITALPSLELVTPSRWLEGLVRRSYLSKYPVIAIHPGVDLSAFCPTESSFRRDHGLLDRHMVLGVASAWSRSKGLDDFRLLADRLGADYAVVLVGLTPDRIPDMPSNILCIPRTDSIAALAQIYTAADVFVNLSYFETFGMVNLEAVSCGTAVVTYDSGGTAETVMEGYGTVVPQGDLDAVIDCIHRYTAVPSGPTDAELTRLAPELSRDTASEKYISVICGQN